jgi:hypothetical protein
MYTTKNGAKIRTSLSEMTIKEFEVISQIMGDESKLTIEKYLDILESLGTSEEVLDSMDDQELFAIIKSFNDYEYENVLTRTIELDGFTYEAYRENEEGPVLKAKDMALIEKSLKNNKPFFLNIIAILFKRSDLTKVEHGASAHISHKKQLFANLPADKYYPYVVWLLQKMHNRLEKNIELSQVEENNQ